MKVGFIGCGNMAKAMIRGMISSGTAAENITASALNQSNLNHFAAETGIAVTSDNQEVARKSDVVILAVKPRIYPSTISEISDVMKQNPDKILVSITPGITLEQMRTVIGFPAKIVRTMPNTPVAVNAGMTAICANNALTEEDLEKLISIFQSFGKVERIEEAQFDAVVAISGSSPAYIFMLIEAMADGGVLLGLSRKSAYAFASQAVLGAAKMVQKTEIHPGELKDQVCSPSGTTIEAVRTLESKGFRSAVIEAMVDCAEKSSGKK